MASAMQQQALTAALVDKCLKITEKEVRNHLRNVCVKKIGILFPELDEDVRTKTADYALIQVASERDRADMIKNLQSILGTYTPNFVDWLMVIIRTLSRKTAEVKFDVVHSDVKDHVKNLGQELCDASRARAGNKSEVLATGRPVSARGDERSQKQLRHLDGQAPAVAAARRHLDTDTSKNSLRRNDSGSGKEIRKEKDHAFAVPFSPKRPLARNNSGGVRKPVDDNERNMAPPGGLSPTTLSRSRRRRHSASPRDSTTMPREPSPEVRKMDDSSRDPHNVRRRHSISPTPLIDRTHDYEYYNDLSYGRDRDRRAYRRQHDEYVDREPRRPPMNAAGSARYNDNRYGYSNNDGGGYRNQRRRSLDREWTPYARQSPPSNAYYSRLYQQRLQRYDNFDGRRSSPVHMIEYRNARRRGLDYLPPRDVHAHSRHIISEENKNQIRSVISQVVGPSVTTTSPADTTTNGISNMENSDGSRIPETFVRPTSIHSRLGKLHGDYSRRMPLQRRNGNRGREESFNDADSLYGRLDIKPEKIRITLRQNYIPRDYEEAYESGSGFYGSDTDSQRLNYYADNNSINSGMRLPRNTFRPDDVLLEDPTSNRNSFQTMSSKMTRRPTLYEAGSAETGQRHAFGRTSSSGSRRDGNFDYKSDNFSEVVDERHSQAGHSSKSKRSTGIAPDPCSVCGHNTPVLSNNSARSGQQYSHSPTASAIGGGASIVVARGHEKRPASSSATRRSGNASVVAASTVSKRRRNYNNDVVGPAPNESGSRSYRSQRNPPATISLRSERISLSPLSIDPDDAVSQFEPVSPHASCVTHTIQHNNRDATNDAAVQQRKRVTAAAADAGQHSGDVVYLQDFDDEDVQELTGNLMAQHEPVSSPENDTVVIRQQGQHSVANSNVIYRSVLDSKREHNENLQQSFDDDDDRMQTDSSPPPPVPLYVRQQQRYRQQYLPLLDASNNNNSINTPMLVDMPEEISLDIPRALSPEARERIIAARNRELALFEHRHRLEQQQLRAQFAHGGQNRGGIYDDAGIFHSNLYADNNFGMITSQTPLATSTGRTQHLMLSGSENDILQPYRQVLPSRHSAQQFAAQQQQFATHASGFEYLPGAPSFANIQQPQSTAAHRFAVPNAVGARFGRTTTQHAGIVRTAAVRKNIVPKPDVLDVGRIIDRQKYQRIADSRRSAVSAYGDALLTSNSKNRPPIRTTRAATMVNVPVGSFTSGQFRLPATPGGGRLSGAARVVEKTPVLQQTSNAGAKVSSQKLARLCPWWPTCNRGNYCNNLHPKVNRRCQFAGNCNVRPGNCCYQHPHCYFGSQGTCTNLMCRFDHGNANCSEAELEVFKAHAAKRALAEQVVQSPYPAPTTYTRVEWLNDADRELLPPICQMWLRNKCANAACGQMHRTKQGCMFHPMCGKRDTNDCPYLHPDEIDAYLPIDKGGGSSNRGANDTLLVT